MWSRYSPLWYSHKGLKSAFHRGTCTSVVSEVVFTNLSIHKHNFNGIFLTHTKEQSYIVCRKQCVIRDYHINWVTPTSERQRQNIFSLLWLSHFIHIQKCIYIWRVETNLCVGKKETSCRGVGRIKNVRRNMLKVHFKLVWKCLYITQYWVGWICANGKFYI